MGTAFVCPGLLTLHVPLPVVPETHSVELRTYCVLYTCAHSALVMTVSTTLYMTSLAPEEAANIT